MADAALEENREVSRPLLWIFPGEQRAENRIAIETRETAPDDRRIGVDESAQSAVANQGKIERCHSMSSKGLAGLAAECIGEP